MRPPDDSAVLKAMAAAREAEINQLYQVNRELQRHRFGWRAKSRAFDQFLLGPKEAERIYAKSLAGTDAADTSGVVPIAASCLMPHALSVQLPFDTIPDILD